MAKSNVARRTTTGITRAGLIAPVPAEQAIAELSAAMWDVLDAEDAPMGGERDLLVMSAFRRIRGVQHAIGAACVGGAS